jgi:hypothetical protein
VATPAIAREAACGVTPDQAFPPLTVRQRALSVPKRLRWFLEREPRAVSAVLHILLRVIDADLRNTSPRSLPLARLGAVNFVNRLGSSLTSLSVGP